jgi:hypothetical protein
LRQPKSLFGKKRVSLSAPRAPGLTLEAYGRFPVGGCSIFLIGPASSHDGEAIGIGIALLDRGVYARHDGAHQVRHDASLTHRRIRGKDGIPACGEYLHVERRTLPCQPEGVDVGGSIRTAVHPHNKREARVLLKARRQQQCASELRAFAALPLDEPRHAKFILVEMFVQARDLERIRLRGAEPPQVRGMQPIPRCEHNLAGNVARVRAIYSALHLRPE